MKLSSRFDTCQLAQEIQVKDRHESHAIAMREYASVDIVSFSKGSYANNVISHLKFDGIVPGQLVPERAHKTAIPGISPEDQEALNKYYTASHKMANYLEDPFADPDE